MHTWPRARLPFVAGGLPISWSQTRGARAAARHRITCLTLDLDARGRPEPGARCPAPPKLGMPGVAIIAFGYARGHDKQLAAAGRPGGHGRERGCAEESEERLSESAVLDARDISFRLPRVPGGGRCRFRGRGIWVDAVPPAGAGARTWWTCAASPATSTPSPTAAPGQTRRSSRASCLGATQKQRLRRALRPSAPCPHNC
jgi:hypothetical protein